MFGPTRLLRSILIFCLASAFALAIWLLAFFASSQTAIPVAAQEEAVPSSTPTDMPTNTPLPELIVNKSSQVIGDQNANGRTDPGDTVSYTVTVKNIGSYAASDVEIQDDYDDTLLEKPDKISGEGVVNEGIIVWKLERLDAEEEITVTYDVKVSPIFPSGKSTIKNFVTVKIQGVTSTTHEYKIEIAVTATSTPTTTPTPAATQTSPPTLASPLAPTAAPASQSAGPTGQVISGIFQGWLAIVFIIASMGGLMVFAFLTHKGKEIPTTLRDGYILTLIMGTVIILGLAGSVERSAIAGLIGTVAGYVLRGVVEGGKPEGGKPEGGEPKGGEPKGGEPKGGKPEGGVPKGDKPKGG